MSRLSLRFLLLGLLLLAPASPVGAAPEKIFRFQLNYDPKSLDWNRAALVGETLLINNLMEGLLSVSDDFKPQPALAESYQVSPDGKTITFTLRSGVLWSDGVPLKVDDFIYSWKRLLSPLTAAYYAYLLFDVVGAHQFYDGKLKDFSKVGIRALDSRRIEVKLNSPVSHWPFLVVQPPLFPLRKDIVEKHGDSWATSGKMVTLGPYLLESREIGSKLVLVPNPRYSGKRGNLTRIEAHVIGEDSSALALFDAGKLDFVKDLSASAIRQRSKSPQFKVFPNLGTIYLGMCVTHYPTSLEVVRRAIAHAIDRQEIAAGMGGQVAAAMSFLPSKLSGKRKEVGIPFDPQRARSLLRMAGVEPAELRLDLLVRNPERNVQLGKLIKAQLFKNLGIQVDIKDYETRIFQDQLQYHAYPLFGLSWFADFPDPENFLSIFTSSSGMNHTDWKNPSYDRMVIEARGKLKASERAALYESAERLLLEKEAVIVPIYYDATATLISSRSRGVSYSPMNDLRLKLISVD